MACTIICFSINKFPGYYSYVYIGEAALLWLWFLISKGKPLQFLQSVQKGGFTKAILSTEYLDLKIGLIWL